MILKFFYIYPIAKIQEIFPNIVNPATENYMEYKACKRGWTSDMAQFNNTIRRIVETCEDDCLRLEDTPYWWDSRLGIILNVDTEIRNGYYFLNKDAETKDTGTEYHISMLQDKNTVGIIFNKPLKQSSSFLNKVLKRK